MFSQTFVFSVQKLFVCVWTGGQNAKKKLRFQKYFYTCAWGLNEKQLYVIPQNKKQTLSS